VQLISELIAVLNNQFSDANLKNFGFIIESILGISKSVTTLSVARMSSLSYRTVQRFYAIKDVNWLLIRLLIFKHFIYKSGQRYLLAGDETVEGKAGKHTFGIGYFYSSVAQRAIKSVSFLAISIIDISSRSSYVLACQQIIAKPSLKKEKEQKAKAKDSKPKGRPKGSKNKSKESPTSASYTTLKTLLSLLMSQLSVVLPDLSCFHLVLDGFYGHEDYLLLALVNQVQIISKFKSNAHLILPFVGTQSGKGRPKTKGNKIDFDKIDSKFLVETQRDETAKIITHIYQFQARTPKIKNTLLNIIIISNINIITKKQSRTILFSNDLTLDAPTLIDYYSLRFQIEFDFRDAKQFYGLSNFKNYKETQVTNAVNLAFSMTVIGKVILKKYKSKFNCQSMGIHDLKTVYRIEKYVNEFFKYNSQNDDDFLNSPQFLNVARLEAIHI
jgi:putative transposase